MSVLESLLKAVESTGVPLDPLSVLSTDEKFYLLGEVANDELLRVREFFGIALLAAAAVHLKGEHCKLDYSWLGSDEAKSIRDFFINSERNA